MSSIYDHHLPLAFPFAFVVPEETAMVCVTLLMRNSSLCPNGSSFAITSDAPQGHRHLWLSKASLQLVKNIILAGSSPEQSEPVEDVQDRTPSPRKISDEDLKLMLAFRQELDNTPTAEEPS